MKKIAFCTMISLLAASACLLAQTASYSFDPSPGSAGSAGQATPPVKSSEGPAPFSRLGLSVGVGVNGINFQAAVEANRYINIRGVGNYFSYSLTVKSGGVTDSGTLNFATAGVSGDIYPFPNHGWRVSPGLLFYNQNAVSLSGGPGAGKSFKENSDTYYSSPTEPVTEVGSVNLNHINPAFTLTTGWGNLISRKGGHFSVPFEIGAAFVGSPTVNLTYTGGEVCSDTAGDPPCYTASTYTPLLTDTTAQIAKYNKDLDPLKVYPIFSLGIGYNFSIH